MGIFAVLLSAVFSTSKDILSKKLAVRIDGHGLHVRFVRLRHAVLPGGAAGLWLLGHDIFTFSVSFWWLVVARAVTDTFAEGMKMYAFAHGDISLVSILFSFSPLCVLMLSLGDDQRQPVDRRRFGRAAGGGRQRRGGIQALSSRFREAKEGDAAGDWCLDFFRHELDLRPPCGGRAVAAS